MTFGLRTPNYQLRTDSSTAVTRVAVDAGSSFFVTVDAKGHVIPIDHLDRPLHGPCETVAD